MPPATAVSSPGKVLLAGGYLVLDPKYSGVVVATSSRFYTVVAALPASAARTQGPVQIRVRSPQFVDATWLYLVHVDQTGVRVEQAADESVTSTKNKFVQLALQETLRLVWEAKGPQDLRDSLATGLDVTIAGDNDFYSQRAQLANRKLPPTLASLAQLPPFLHTGVRLPEVHKTGLGSSAALITSLVSALLLHLGAIPRDSFAAADGLASASDGRKLAHNVAQYVHCLAQGKVGSGFDVSSAVFGSQLYTRFDPQVLQPLMENHLESVQSLSRILSPSNPAWDYRVAPFRLPPHTRLMLADVDAGSDTPSLVGKVLKWRKERPAEADALWETLNAHNQALSRVLLKLSDLAAAQSELYAVVVRYLASLQSAQWLAHPNIPTDKLKIIEAFAEAHQLTEAIRARMREMGTAAGVPIEPPEQTALLDGCGAVAGVIGGGVPGAGGYDAIWVLVFDPAGIAAEELPSRRVEAQWQSWTALSVSPLSAGESAAKGVRVEELGAVPGLGALVAQ
ncbi:phosphomevalonate kinase [Phanerochaete sordida]|uniref:Phosphomevalonate kinase n=1 Tax=Phanerochaete sordida TaxID=48140 RepID=A0A9P3LHT1_9APHY|nr:phosphomevalonate kinase [Phanerochaete sordida]